MLATYLRSRSAVCVRGATHHLRRLNEAPSYGFHDYESWKFLLSNFILQFWFLNWGLRVRLPSIDSKWDRQGHLTCDSHAEHLVPPRVIVWAQFDLFSDCTRGSPYFRSTLCYHWRNVSIPTRQVNGELGRSYIMSSLMNKTSCTENSKSVGSVAW
jgi:hypothetical protein